MYDNQKQSTNQPTNETRNATPITRQNIDPGQSTGDSVCHVFITSTTCNNIHPLIPDLPPCSLSLMLYYALVLPRHTIEAGFFHLLSTCIHIHNHIPAALFFTFTSLLSAE